MSLIVSLFFHIQFSQIVICLSKDDIEEEDGDSIEKVLWHQPKGTAEEAERSHKSTEPVLLSQLFDSEPNWNEMEFLIKWKGQSHLHCQWKLLSELQNVSLQSSYSYLHVDSYTGP